MDNEVIQEQVEKIEEYYVENLDELIEQEDAKKFDKRCRGLEAILNAKAAADRAETEKAKADAEIEKGKVMTKLEQDKVEIDRLRLELEQKKAELEMKVAKGEVRLGTAKLALMAAGIVASIAVSIWGVIVTMKFEEYGSLVSSCGKLAQGFYKGAIGKIDKICNS